MVLKGTGNNRPPVSAGGCFRVSYVQKICTEAVKMVEKKGIL